MTTEERKQPDLVEVVAKELCDHVTLGGDTFGVAMADSMYVDRMAKDAQDCRRMVGEMSQRAAKAIIAKLEARGIPLQALAEGRMVPMPVEPDDGAMKASMQSRGLWQVAHEAARECGVPVECGLTQEEADAINAELMEDERKAYRAMISARPSVSVPEGGEG